MTLPRWLLLLSVAGAHAGCATLSGFPAPASDDLASIASDVNPGPLPPFQERLEGSSVRLLQHDATLPDAQGKALEAHIEAHLDQVPARPASKPVSEVIDQALVAAAEADGAHASWAPALLVRALAALHHYLIAWVAGLDVKSVMMPDDAQAARAREGVHRLLDALQLHERAAWAKVLRNGSDAPNVRTVLERVVEYGRLAERPELSLHAQEALMRRGVPDPSEGWASLARLYDSNLRVPEGEEAARRARRVSSAQEWSVAQPSVEAYRRNALQLQALASRDDLESQLARGWAWFELGQRTPAFKAFEAARARAPQDARPLLGEAAVAIIPNDSVEDSLNLAPRAVQATVFLERARPLEHQDATSLEIEVGLTSYLLGVRLDAARLVELESLLKRFAPLDGVQGRAATLLLMLEWAKPLRQGKGMPAFLTRLGSCLADTGKLRKDHPQGVMPAQLEAVCAALDSHREQCLQAMTAPLPAGLAADPELVLQRARSLLLTSTSMEGPFSRDRDARSLQDSASAVPHAAPRVQAQLQALRADVAMVQAATARGNGDWNRVATENEKALAGELPDSDRARALLNLGYAEQQLKRTEQAETHWKAAAEMGEGVAFVTQLQRLLPQAEQPETRAQVEAISPAHASKRAQEWWQAWRIVLAQRAGDRAAATALARALLQHRKEADVPDGQPLPGVNGFFFERSLQVGVGWRHGGAAEPEGLHLALQITVTPELYAVPPTPLTLELVRELAQLR